MNDMSMFERLEDRTLLAVSVALGKKGVLSLLGNDANDVVDIEGTGLAGQVDVFVGGAFVGRFSAVKSISADLRNGNDDINLAAIQIGGIVDIRMGAGDDDVDVDNTPDVGASADNTVSIGDLLIHMGGNASDNVNISSDSGSFGISFARDLVIEGVTQVDINGNGGTFATQLTDVNVGRNLRIAASSFVSVDIDLDDINVLGTTTIVGGGANDRVEITDSSFARSVSVSLGLGNDVVDLDNGAGEESAFSATVIFDGGAGTDTLDNFPGNLFAVAPTVKLFEVII